MKQITIILLLLFASYFSFAQNKLSADGYAEGGYFSRKKPIQDKILITILPLVVAAFCNTTLPQNLQLHYRPVIVINQMETQNGFIHQLKDMITDMDRRQKLILTNSTI